VRSRRLGLQQRRLDAGGCRHPADQSSPFAGVHQWDAEVRYPNFFSRDLEDWCNYVARSQCARLADDQKLIGYFYTDCPC
jgi:hypothetical protein